MAKQILTPPPPKEEGGNSVIETEVTESIEETQSDEETK